MQIAGHLGPPAVDGVVAAHAAAASKGHGALATQVQVSPAEVAGGQLATVAERQPVGPEEDLPQKVVHVPSDVALQGHHHPIFSGPDPILVPALTRAVQDTALADQQLRHVFRGDVAQGVVNCDDPHLPMEEWL